MDLTPQLNPDGYTVVLLRGGVDARPQLAIVSAEGGGPGIVTGTPLGVDEFVWSRDSRELAFVAGISEERHYGTLEGVPAERENPRLIVGNKYQTNGIGYIRDRPRGIYLPEAPFPDEEPWLGPRGHVATGTGEGPGGNTMLGGRRGIPQARLLALPETDCRQPEFTPDGKRICFTAALHAGEDSDLRPMIHRVPAAGGEPVLVTEGAETTQVWSWPRFSRDGRALFLLMEHLGESGLGFVGNAKATAALAIGVGPGAEPRVLTGPVTSDCETPWSFLEPLGEESILAPAQVRGCGGLHVISSEGRVHVLVRDPKMVGMAAEHSGVSVVVASEATRPMEFVGVAEGGFVCLTDSTRPLVAAVTPVEPGELIIQGRGGNGIHGWVFVLKGRGPYPVPLNVHGGPFSNFNWVLFDEARVYVRAGYTMV